MFSHRNDVVVFVSGLSANVQARAGGGVSSVMLFKHGIGMILNPLEGTAVSESATFLIVLSRL